MMDLTMPVVRKKASKRTMPRLVLGGRTAPNATIGDQQEAMSLASWQRSDRCAVANQLYRAEELAS